jgi:hypothetical protein
MASGDRQLRRFLALAISAHKDGDPKLANKLLDSAIEHVAKTAALAVQQHIQPTKKR